jgi:GMP synthase-like glutamine amidotransferase
MPPATRIGIVSMSRSGAISDAVQQCFQDLGCTIHIYPWFHSELYEVIRYSDITHWFFTGNTPDLVTDFNAPVIDPRIYELHHKCMFFVCYSHQLLCLRYGAIIRDAHNRVNGNYLLIRRYQDRIWRGVDDMEKYMCWYAQYVHYMEVPPGWLVLARRGHHIALMRRGLHYSSQVHPERRPETYQILRNWLALMPGIKETSRLGDWLHGWSFFSVNMDII